MKSVLIEGIAGAGKTALITALKVELKRFGGFDVKELSHIDCDDQYGRYLREYSTLEHVVLHRSHVSEHVLSTILREKTSFGEEELTTLDAVVASRFVCVLVEPPNFKSFSERMSERRVPQVPFDEEKFTRTVASFREAFARISHLYYVSSSVEAMEATKDAIVATLLQGGRK